MLRLFARSLRVWFDLSLTIKGMVVVAVPLICTLFLALALYTFQAQRDQLTQWIGRAFQAGASVQAIITLLTDAATGTRGFLLTDDPKHLEPYRRAKRELSQRVARLRESLAGNSLQLQRAERIESHARLWLATLDKIVSRPESFVLRQHLEYELSLMSAIQQEASGIRAGERALWVARTGAETALRRTLSMATYAAAFVSVLAGSLAMALFVAGIVRRLRVLSGNADRLARGEELVDLPPGLDEIGHLGDALTRSSHLLGDRERELRQLNQELDVRVKERTSQLEREVADRRRSEEQLRQAQKMEAVGRLAGEISHDFNNLLTVITGYANLMLQELASDSPHRETVNEISLAAKRAAEVTSGLLAFSRRQLVQRSIINVNSVVRNLEKMLRRLIREDVQILVVLEPDLWDVSADPTQLEQVIVNLAVNARDAMPTGGTLTIETANVELDELYASEHLGIDAGQYSLLAISDTGTGMDRETQSRIFEPFFTTKDSGKGTGLGLSMVYGILQQNGGSISVYSELGIGTTFKAYLPRTTASKTTDSEAVVSAGESVQGRGATILLVEDENSLRKLASTMLERSGFKVLTARTGADALAICEQNSGTIDLVLSDIVMPRMSGRQLGAEIRQRHPGVRLLFMSGYTEQATANQDCLGPGVHFLSKPFTAIALVSKVREALASPADQIKKR
jgi:signal transduction histidine kinase/ActR/RegA family two-component response regulator